MKIVPKALIAALASGSVSAGLARLYPARLYLAMVYPGVDAFKVAPHLRLSVGASVATLTDGCYASVDPNILESAACVPDGFDAATSTDY